MMSVLLLVVALIASTVSSVDPFSVVKGGMLTAQALRKLQWPCIVGWCVPGNKCKTCGLIGKGTAKVCVKNGRDCIVNPHNNQIDWGMLAKNRRVVVVDDHDEEEFDELLKHLEFEETVLGKVSDETAARLTDMLMSTPDGPGLSALSIAAIAGVCILAVAACAKIALRKVQANTTYGSVDAEV